MKTLRFFAAFALVAFVLVIPFAVSFAQIGAGDPPKLPNPLENNVDSVSEFVEAVLTNIVLPIGAVVVVFFIIYSGYLFVTAGGNEDKISDAKNTFKWVVIGSAILLGSWAIAKAVQGTVCQIAPSICGRV